MSAFTVVVDEPQHFGDEPGDYPGVAHHSGDGTFEFDCPRIDEAQATVLTFRTKDVSLDSNEFYLGQWLPPEAHFDIPRGIPRSGPAWTSNVVVIPPGWVKASGNRLNIGSRDAAGGIGGDKDDFLVADVVVFYNHRQSRLQILLARLSPWGR